MARTFIDDWKILPRLMMLAVTVLTYQSVHWFMTDSPTDRAGRRLAKGQSRCASCRC